MEWLPKKRMPAYSITKLQLNSTQIVLMIAPEPCFQDYTLAIFSKQLCKYRYKYCQLLKPTLTSEEWYRLAKYDLLSCSTREVYLLTQTSSLKGISSAWLFSGDNITVSILGGAPAEAEADTNQRLGRGCALPLLATCQVLRVITLAFMRHFRPNPS